MGTNLPVLQLLNQSYTLDDSTAFRQDENQKVDPSISVILLDKQFNLQQRTHLMTLSLRDETFNRFNLQTDWKRLESGNALRNFK